MQLSNTDSKQIYYFSDFDGGGERGSALCLNRSVCNTTYALLRVISNQCIFIYFEIILLKLIELTNKGFM